MSIATAQERQPNHVDKPTVIRTESRLVLVEVTATDKNGKPIRELTGDDFQLLGGWPRADDLGLVFGERIPVERALSELYSVVLRWRKLH